MRLHDAEHLFEVPVVFPQQFAAGWIEGFQTMAAGHEDLFVAANSNELGRAVAVYAFTARPAEITAAGVVGEHALAVLAASEDCHDALGNQRRAGKPPAGRLEFFVTGFGFSINGDVVRPNQLSGGGVEAIEHAAAAK